MLLRVDFLDLLIDQSHPRLHSGKLLAVLLSDCIVHVCKGSELRSFLLLLLGSRLRLLCLPCQLVCRLLFRLGGCTVLSFILLELSEKGVRLGQELLQALLVLPNLLEVLLSAPKSDFLG